MNRPATILTQLETSLSVAPEALAQRFGVGSKTIATDVAQINQALGAAGSIRLEQGRYRLLVVDADAFRKVRDRMVDERASFNDQDQRFSYILARLLRSDVPVRSEELAFAMKVGRTTVVADLADLRDLIAPLGVSIEGRTHVGLALSGPELGIRLAVLRYAYAAAYDHYELGPELEEALQSVAAVPGLTTELSATIQRWATVMLDRYMGGYELPELPAEYQDLIGSAAHGVARDLAVRIEPQIAEQLPDAEVLFLAIPAAGMRTPSDLEGMSGLPSPSASQALVRRIFARIAQTMDLQIDPEDLLAEFSHHVAFMINRMRYSLKVGDVATADQMRQQYPVAFRLATIARDVIGEETGLVMDDSELSLATTYFQVFLEDHTSRRQPDFNVAITTGRGPGVARLIHSQLAKVLPASARYVLLSDTGPEEDFEAVDLIVTTPGIRLSTKTPTLELSEVFDRGELVRKLAGMRFPRYGPLSLAGGSGSVLVSLLDEDRFLVLPEKCTYVEGVRRLSDHLQARGLVDDAFRAALAEREARSTMQLDDCVAFPHAVTPNGTSLVCAMGLIARGDAEEGLRVIFLMAVPEKSAYDDTILIRAYGDVIRMGANRALLNKISRLTTYEQFFYLMESTAESHYR
jgi:lichenan operon transcriptional antiterminator